MGLHVGNWPMCDWPHVGPAMVFVRIGEWSFYKNNQWIVVGVLPPPKMEPIQVEMSEVALVVQTERSTVGDFQRNMKFVTHLEHRISIPRLADEIYCILPSHSLQIIDNRSINLIFERCGKCKLCLEVNAIQLNNVLSIWNNSQMPLDQETKMYKCK